MKSFEELMDQLRHMGIVEWDSSPKARKITFGIRCCLIVTYTSLFLASVWFFLFEAQTPRDHSKSLFCTLSIFLIIPWYLTFLFTYEKRATNFDELNSIMEKSQLKVLNKQI